jgi:hypothetical protein
MSQASVRNFLARSVSVGHERRPSHRTVLAAGVLPSDSDADVDGEQSDDQSGGEFGGGANSAPERSWRGRRPSQRSRLPRYSALIGRPGRLLGSATGGPLVAEVAWPWRMRRV